MASPETITVGESSELAWTLSGDSPISLSLSPDVGVDLVSPLTVSPTETTTYTLTATNDAGSSSASVTITVQPDDSQPDDSQPEPEAPTIDTFTASVNDLTATFSWSITASESVGCTLDVGDGSAVRTLGDCLGTQTASHTYGTAGTYTATLALTSGATATAALTVVGSNVEQADCGGDFVITTQSDLDALSGCGVIGSLTIDPTAEVSSQQTEDDPITSLAPLANVTGITHSLVIANTALTDLTGLDTLASVGGDVTISNNSALTSLVALANLTSIAGNITVSDNGALLALTGLENVAGYDDGNVVTVVDNSSLDCSQPALPFVVDVSQGNAVDCEVAAEAPANSVRFLAPLDYLPNLNIFVDLTAGISQRVTIERYGTTVEPLTVQLQVVTPPSTIAVGDVRINGNRIGETFEVTFPATRSRTTFDLSVVGDALDEVPELLVLAFVETPAYGLVEPAELRFDVQADVQAPVIATPEQASLEYYPNLTDPLAVRIHRADGSITDIYADKNLDGSIANITKIDVFLPGITEPSSMYFGEQQRLEYINLDNGTLLQLDWQSNQEFLLRVLLPDGGEQVTTTVVLDEPTPTKFSIRRGFSRQLPQPDTSLSTNIQASVTKCGFAAISDDIAYINATISANGTERTVPLNYESFGLWTKDITYSDGFPTPYDGTLGAQADLQTSAVNLACDAISALNRLINPTRPRPTNPRMARSAKVLPALPAIAVLGSRLLQVAAVLCDFREPLRELIYNGDEWFGEGDTGTVQLEGKATNGVTAKSNSQDIVLGVDGPAFFLQFDDDPATEDRDECVEEATIASFTANPEVITAGETSTLAWAVDGSEPLTVTIEPNFGPDIGDVSDLDSKSIEVSPTETTTYTLTATNFDGTDTREVTVEVRRAPTIDFFRATPSFIFSSFSGEESTLTWNVRSTDPFDSITLTIEPGIGDVSDVDSVTISPTATTTYTLTATNEEGSNTATATVTVDGKEEEDDNVDDACQDCIEGSNIGDPRYRTFDGLFYEFQGVGEYILLESLDDDLVIQTRQAPWQDSTTVSINSGVAAQVGADRVGIYVDQASVLYINGEPTELASGERLQLDGGSVRREDSRYTVMWADQTTLITSLRNDFVNVRVLIAPERAGRVAGLLGDANSSRANDLATREGRVFEQPLTFEQLYQEYGNSWRISQEESLLDYLGEATGIGTAFYTDFNFPSSVPTITDEARAFAEEVCNAANITDPILLEACILDVALTGDASFAEGYGEIAAPEELLPPPEAPTPSEAPRNVQQIAAGGDHSLAITADGNLWAWGSNGGGQLGDGTNNDSNVPVRITGLSNVQQIAAGESHSLAITADGNLWAWGLGDGTDTRSNVPVRVTGLSNVQRIAAGGDHSLAITADGNLWAWGDNFYGQLGDGTNNASNVPVRVTGLSNVQQIAAAGGVHSLAITADGNLWAWGSNLSGRLGDGTNNNSNVPVRVTGLSNVQQIAAGSRHSLAITADGNLWAWGNNNNGRLGNGTNNPSNVPIRVNGLSAAQQTSLVR